MYGIVFGAASIIAIVSAILCVTRRSPVASALWLVSVMFQLAVLYVLLDAQFLAAVQVLVYAGAIMVLFLFVIMLLNIGRPGPSDMKGALGRVAGIVVGLIVLAELIGLRQVRLPRGGSLPDGTIARMVEQQGPLHAVATPLFQQYLIPFEITSVMLLAALVGGVVLAKRRID